MSITSSRYQRAKYVTLIGALVNTLLGFIKLIGGFWFHSNALVADGFHSLSDLFTDAMVLIASKYGSQDADEKHPYGHQRIETAATYILAILLIITGLAISGDAFNHLRTHTYDHPGLPALPLAGLSIIANEVLFWYTRYVGESIGSNLIIANAWHHRSDAASSLIVLLGLIGTFAGFPMLDSTAALLVGLLIAKMGLDYGLKSIKELIDTGVDDNLRNEIITTIRETDGVDKIHQLRTRLMGSDVYVDVHVQVHPLISVSEGHFIAQHVHRRLKNMLPSIKDVTVHIDPEDDETVSPSHDLPSRNHLEKILLTNWYHDFPELTSCVFHYLDNTLTLDLIGSLSSNTQEYLTQRIQKDLQELLPDVNCCIRIQSAPKIIYQRN